MADGLWLDVGDSGRVMKEVLYWVVEVLIWVVDGLATGIVSGPLGLFESSRKTSHTVFYSF